MVESEVIIHRKLNRNIENSVILDIKELFETTPGIIFSVNEFKKRFRIGDTIVIEIMGILNRDYGLKLRYV